MEELEEYLNSFVNDGITSGFTYGIISKHKYVGSVGYKCQTPNKEVTNLDTLYDIASLSKVLVVLPLIFKLVKNNRISFNDTIKQYLPDFMYDNITIYQLLTHTAGFPSEFGTKDIIDKDILIKIIYDTKIVNKVGEFLYCDIGYILLGFIIEKIYGESLDVVANREIFEKLDMKKTVYNPNDKYVCAPTEFTEKRGISEISQNNHYRGSVPVKTGI